MPSVTLKQITPESAIAFGLGAAGTAKLAGAQFTRDNFERWGYADWWRPLIGAMEVATAGAALLATSNPTARRLAAIGTLSTMGGAIATHLTAQEPGYNLIPPLALSGLGARLAWTA